jgi:prepilin-type N-terminal cleavage/methylation domain-containing protein
VTRPRPITARNRPAAFTLLEVLLVLSLMVILASLAYPALDRPMATQSLRSGVDNVRTSWVKARIAAMKTGHTYLFRYAPGGDHYVVECQITPELAADADVSGSGSTGGTVQDPTTEYAEDRHLPDNIRFGGGQSVADSRAQTAASTDATTAATAADAQLAWADPIYFYPDGTTSTAVLRVQNRYERMIELSLRGLTGVVTVSPMQDAPLDSGGASQGSG